MVRKSVRNHCESGKYRINSLGTPPRLTFQARLLHNQEGANAEKAVFERSRRELSSDVSVGVYILLIVEQPSLERQSSGCAKTPILTVYLF